MTTETIFHEISHRWTGALRALAAHGPDLRRWTARALAAAATLLALGFVLTGTRYRDVQASAVRATLPAAPDLSADERKSVDRERKKLVTALDRETPDGNYIVIDRINNRVALRKGSSVILEGPCSTGSGKTLIDAAGGREWQFETPRGRFRVLQKTKNPLWKKPDWAFVEEGEPIPTDPEDRFEAGVLGEYGLYFGNGYLIHGTLYERLLGRSVSHGCVRVGKEDLRRIYDSSPLGTAIYVH